MWASSVPWVQMTPTWFGLALNGANFSQSLVSASPNHVGVICTQGTACAPGTRNLLDLFEIGIDPRNGSAAIDRKSTRLNSSHGYISYAVFCLKKKKSTWCQSPA